MASADAGDDGGGTEEMVPGEVGCSGLSAAAGVDIGTEHLSIVDLPLVSAGASVSLEGSADAGGDAPTVDVTVQGGSMEWQSDVGVDAVLVTGSSLGGVDASAQVAGDAQVDASAQVAGDALGGEAAGSIEAMITGAMEDAGMSADTEVLAGAAGDVAALVTTLAHIGGSAETSGTVDLSAFVEGAVSLTFCLDASIPLPAVAAPVPAAPSPPSEVAAPAPEPAAPASGETAVESASSSTEEMPRTGSNMTPLLLVGGGLLAAGGGMILGKRFLMGS